MPYAIEVPLEDGGSVLLSADEQDLSGPQRAAASPGAVVGAVSETLEAAVDRIRPAAVSIIGRFTSIDRPPNELTLEFGINVAAEAGLVVAKGSAEANFKLTLVWKRDERPMQS